MRLRKEHIELLIGWTLKEEPISVDLSMKLPAPTNLKLSTYYLLHRCIFCISFCTKSTPMRNPWATGLDAADAAWVEKKSWHLEWKRSCCLPVESLPSGSWSCQQIQQLQVECRYKQTIGTIDSLCLRQNTLLKLHGCLAACGEPGWTLWLAFGISLGTMDLLEFCGWNGTMGTLVALSLCWNDRISARLLLRYLYERWGETQLVRP